MTAEIRYPARPAARRERQHHRSARRQNIAILVTASLVGLWLGATAPSVSPASPATAPAKAATPTPVVNTNPAPPDEGGPRGPGGGRTVTPPRRIVDGGAALLDAGGLLGVGGWGR